MSALQRRERRREASRTNLFVNAFVSIFFIDDSYGQTGTGKTFTMEGERSPDEQFTWEEVSSLLYCLTLSLQVDLIQPNHRVDELILQQRA